MGMHPLLVLGATGHSAISRMLLGSTSDYVATHAPCSALIVRPRVDARIHHPLRIAIGYEDTGPAQAALEEMSEMKWSSGVVFHVVSVAYVYGLLDSSDIAHMRKSGDRAVERLQSVGSKGQFHLVQSDHPGEGLVKYVEGNDIDILVVGETPRTRLGRVLMGSMSRYALRHAPCSVWITRNRIIHGVQA